MARERMTRWATAFRLAGWIGTVAIVVLSVVPGSERPHTGLSGRYEHVIAYALTSVAFGLGSTSVAASVRHVVMLALLSAGLETAQIWIPGRNASLTDIGAGTLGAVIGMIAAAVAGRRR